MTATTDKDLLDPNILLDARVAWGRKDQACKEEDHADIVPQVSFFRDGKLLLSALANRIDRDMALGIAVMGAAPLEADLIVLHVDAHMTKVMNNPLTGEPWKAGEMQKACDEQGMCMTDILTDCITSIGVFRDGRVQQYSRPYHGHEKAGEMVWDDDDSTFFDSTVKGQSSQGLVVDTMLHAWDNADSLNVGKMVVALGNSRTGRVDLDALLLVTQMLTLTGLALGSLMNPETEEDRDLLGKYLTDDALAQAAQSDLGSMFYLRGVHSGWIEDPETKALIDQHGIRTVLNAVLSVPPDMVDVPLPDDLS